MKKEDDQEPPRWYNDSLSAQVRARLLFAREAEIDAAKAASVFTDEVFEGLVRQRATLETQRTRMLQAAIVLTFTMFFVSNGQSLTLPYVGIDLASVPGLSALLGFTTSFTLLMLSLCGANIGAYGGLIDQFSRRRAKDGLVDQDIVSASIAPTQLVLKILNARFSWFHTVHVKPYWLGTSIYNLALWSTTTVLLGSGLFIYTYTAYFLITNIPNNYFGIGSKAISLFTLLAALLVHIAVNWSFKQRVYLVGPAQIEEIEQAESLKEKDKRKSGDS